jgi:hypothetical protein
MFGEGRRGKVANLGPIKWQPPEQPRSRAGGGAHAATSKHLNVSVQVSLGYEQRARTGTGLTRSEP